MMKYPRGSLAAWYRADASVLWEQLALPLATRGLHVVEFVQCWAVVFKRRQVLMIHDAAIFDVPHGYSVKFRLWYRFSFALLKRNVRHILTVSVFRGAYRRATGHFAGQDSP